MAKNKIIILFSLCSVLLGIIFIPGYLKIKRLSRQNIELEKQIEEVKQANKRLTEEREMMQTDPVYLEKIARQKLGMVKKGEVVYKVIPGPENQ